jgi:DNA-binding CsgD family transcriptional regulator
VDTDQSVLTARELEVLRLLADGHTNREVAARLYISIRTAEFHRANIQRKLNAKSRADLLRLARQIGLAGS